MIKHIVFSVIIFLMALLTSCQYEVTSKRWVNDSLVQDKTHITDPHGGGGVSSYAFRDFSSLDISGAVEVIYTQGDSYSVRIEEVSNLQTVVRKNNHELSVFTKNPKGKLISFGNVKRPKVFITSPYLTDLKVSGACSFSTKQLTGTDLQVDLSGASKLDIGQLTGTKFNLHAGGATKLSLNMKVTDVKISTSGAMKGNIKYVGKNIQITNSGASKLDLDVDCEKLNVSCSGASKVDVKGYVDDLKINSSGASKIDTSQLHY